MICIPDSLLLIYKGKRVYRNALLCQTNLNDAKSGPFVSRNEETKCLCFYFDRPFSARLNLAVAQNQRRTIVFGEDY